MTNIADLNLSDAENAALLRVKRGKSISEEMRHCLASHHLIENETYIGPGNRVRCDLTVYGWRYLDHIRRRREDKAWERGLAIAAIVISTAALFVAILSLWLQWKAL